MPARHYLVTGRVQGVGYRDWTVRRARALGLDGWVRNRADGAVEVVASGSGPLLDAFLAALRDGPPLASVDAIEIAEAEPPPQGFSRRPTA